MMKKIFHNTIMNKVMLGLLGVAMSVIAAGVISMDGSQVLAATGDEVFNDSTYKDYLTVEYDAATATAKINAKVAPNQPKTSGCEDWLFAGWYQEVKCETAISTKDEVTEVCFAKFVPRDVLSVKCQATEGTDANSTDTNLRFITSIDTDQYRYVGFEISRPGKVYPEYKTQDAFKRIEASAEAKVEYKYSPKVIDTKSEAFVTYTITGIPNTEENRYFDTLFMAKPYWVTLDGTKVYGVTRYVKVSDCYNNVVNIPVQVEPQESYSSSEFVVEKYTNATTSAAIESGIVAVYYNANEKYVAVAVSGQTGLPSATKYEVTHNSAVTPYVHRNLLTKYAGSGTSDKSWYEVDASAKEFIIATSADLYGFAAVVNEQSSFTNTKFYLIADIEANKGKAGTTGWDDTKKANGEAFGENEEGTNYPWTSIAISGHNFKAIFDGQGHTISGIIGTQGLFQFLQGGRVKNFQLTNSYFAPTGNYAGSVIARAYGGYIENVYSEAFINSSKIITGGIVGGLVDNYTLNITNCRYSGSFTTASGGCAGILGKVENTGATANITGCQFSGQLTTSVNEAGGFIGTNAGIATITNSLSDGTVNATGVGKYYIGGFIGQSAGSKSTITNSMFSGTVNTASTYTGGFIGYNKSTTETKIENCLSNGTINITVKDTDTTVNRKIGGFVGQNDKKLSIKTSFNSGTNVYEGTKTIAGVCRIVGYNTSVDMHLDKAYSTFEGFNGGITHYTPEETVDGFINVQTYSSIDEADLLGKVAFFNMKLFEGDTKWALVEGGTPILKTFIGTATELALPQVPEDVDISWYRGVASNYTICNNEEDDDATKAKKLRGFSYLVGEGITFAEKTVNLGADVVLNDTACSTDEEWTEYLKNNSPEEWIPIGTTEYEFSGTFNGGGHIIRGIYVNSRSTMGTGFFRSTSEGSVVKQLKVENSYISNTDSGYAYIGSIVGNCAGSLQEIYSSAVVNTEGHYAGGIVGQLWNTTSQTDKRVEISNCWFDGKLIIDGRNNCGGIVGGILNGYYVMNNCLNTAEIELKQPTKSAWIGGIGGRVTLNGTRWNGGTAVTGQATALALQNCLNVGLITNSTMEKVGSVFGEINTGVTTENVYATNESFKYVANNTEVSKAFGKVQNNGQVATLCAENTIAGANATSETFVPLGNEDGAWTQTTSTPVLSIFSNYAVCIDVAWYDGDCIIDTPEELIGLSCLAKEQSINKKITLGADIDLNPGWRASENSGRPDIVWSSVGTETRPFAGTFDGQGYSISGLYVENADTKYMGMFGVTASGTEVKNFRILNSYFGQQNPDGFVGSVAGELRGDMSNVYSNAIVKSGDKRSGGLVAWVNGDSTHAVPINITECWFDGKVLDDDEDDGRYVGGIVATIKNGTCNMTNVLFTGEINSNYNGSSAVFLGGIVAELYDAPSSDSVKLNMNSVVSAGTISGEHNHSVCNSVVGRVKTSIRNDGKENAYGVNSELSMKNVFATQDCYPTTHAVEGAKAGTQLTDSGTVDITSTATVSGDVIITSGQDRFIGYGTQEVKNVDGTVVALDFGNVWSMRRNAVPILTYFSSVVKDGSVIATASLSETSLAKELGLEYWVANESIKNAIAYGAGNYLVTYPCASDAQYEEYLEKLEEKNGLNFIEFANNEGTDMYLDGVKNAIYYKEYTKGNTAGEWVLNITYVSKENKIYISINTDVTSLDDNLKSTTSSSTGNAAISLSMLEIVGEDANGNVFGNSFVFQLPNGHFIINDGGRMNSDATKDDGMKLVAYLKELAGEGKDVIIDAWIITHFHGDHCGVLESFFTHPDLREGVYVEAVYASVPSAYALNYVASDQQYDLSKRAMRGIRTLADTDGEAPKVYQMHMGQRYYFNSMTVDVLDTQEQHHCTTWGNTNVPDKFNTSSTNCLFTFKDGNQAVKRVLIGGDATNVNIEYMMQAYGENNLALADIDVFVAYHHGRNTTATYDTTEVNGFTVKGIANTNWADFLLKNTNNEEQLFDVVLFPYHQVYNMTWELGSGYVDDQGGKAYPYNMGTINQYFIDNAKNKTYYHYGNGTVKLIFGKELIVE